MVLHGTDGGNEVKLECDASGKLKTSDETAQTHLNNISSRLQFGTGQLMINGVQDNLNLQQLKCEDGRLRVATEHLFGTPVSLKNNAAINGAYQFNSSSGDVRKGQKLTLSVRCNSLNTNWTCSIGFSIDGINWKDTISNINAVASTHQIHSFDVIAPYWRFVFIANDPAQSWTIDYV